MMQMECSFSTCRKTSEDQFTCDSCFIPKYCSEQCKRKDITTHERWCRPQVFALKDFVPVRTSRKILDVGTYGEVQLMQNTINNKLYALKIIRKLMVSNVIPLKILFREIMIHKTLVHPNIVRLVDHFEDNTKIYLVLEFVEKGSLFDLIRRKIKLSETEACEIFIQTCVALDYLHQNDIIHRDIKPENLLISKEDVVKICDFGWSAQGSDNRGTFCGTLDYMSPEMLNSEQHTYKLDIWALGILLYEMLHGSPPFRAKNPKEQYRLIAAQTYTIGPHVSKTAAQLIRMILQFNPENRPSLVDILKTQWIQEYSESKLLRDMRVNDIKLGDGVITSVIGKVVYISFKTSRVAWLEGEVLRKCVIYDRNNRPIYTPPEEESAPVRFDPFGAANATGALYKKLGIDSGRATPINAGTNSAKISRSNSRRGSLIGTPMASPGPVNRNSKAELEEPKLKETKSTSRMNLYKKELEESPPSKDARLPKSPRYSEEVKRSQQLPPRQTYIEEVKKPEPAPIKKLPVKQAYSNEVNKSQQLPSKTSYQEVSKSHASFNDSRRAELKNFEQISLNPDIIPAAATPKSRPRSSFLSKFSKGQIS